LFIGTVVSSRMRSVSAKTGKWSAGVGGGLFGTDWSGGRITIAVGVSTAGKRLDKNAGVLADNNKRAEQQQIQVKPMANRMKMARGTEGEFFIVSLASLLIPRVQL
jgi:hypothetical protein